MVSGGVKAGERPGGVARRGGLANGIAGKPETSTRGGFSMWKKL